jgi:hypothetical protein
MKIPFVGKSLWFTQNDNGVKQRFLDCFLKILDKKRKKWRELLPDQYSREILNRPIIQKTLHFRIDSNAFVRGYLKLGEEPSFGEFHCICFENANLHAY